MNKEIRNLEPKALWNRFADICDIPHPSKHEAKILEYIIAFAKEQGLSWQQDAVGNVVIRKNATAGYEGRPTVILQAHVDMVPQKNSDKNFDFEKDPISTLIDGEWVTADGTTLGADNGIGCASMLAVLADKTISHPAIEALFTIDEETGLTGANGLGLDMLKGDILINLDSEDEGELYVGCAGASNNTVEMSYSEVAVGSVVAGAVGYELSLMGLKGGHSGLEIILQRGNANKIMVRFVREQAAALGLSVVSIDGGGLRNAIPREARAVVVVPAAVATQFEENVKSFAKGLAYEYQFVEDAIRFGAVRMAAAPAKMMSAADQQRVVGALTAAPNGILRMSDSMKGLVETSTNMSRVFVGEGRVEVLFMTRCMVNYGKRELMAMIRSVFELAGGTVTDTNDYDGWAPNMKSPILATMSAGYKDLYGVTPLVRAIHAGLECGIIGAKYPKLDMISIGPTMKFPHSPDEKVNIATVAKFYEFLLYTLKNIK